jgi:cytochrome P450
MKCSSETKGVYDLPPPRDLDNLPYLSAVLKESLRMRPTSNPLPRITPLDRSVDIAGIANIPAGIRVNCFSWTIHRDPERFPDPDRWIPERWLSDKDNNPIEKEQLLWSFSSGPRMCVGNHLTQYCKSALLLSSDLLSTLTLSLIS